MASWVPAPGYEGIYEVSNDGRVRRSRAGRGTRAGHVLSGRPTKNGYIQVFLRKDGVSKNESVHRLVLSAFIGPAPEGTEACHNDGNPSNNHISNLRWDTHLANQSDILRHGKRALKPSCPRGHLLSGENLVSAAWRNRGVRTCKACARATDYARSRGIPFDAGIADAKYKDVMSGVKGSRWSG